MVKQKAHIPQLSQPEIAHEDSVKWSTISLSEVFSRDGRLEASVYDIKGKQAREVLSHCRWDVVSLWSDQGLIESAWYPPRFKRIYVEKGGIPFYLPSQLNEVNPKPSKFISEKTATDFESIKVKRNQLLLTRSGTVGNCTVVSATLEDRVFSDDVIRIKFKNFADVGYVYAFFKTDLGQTLIQTNNYGAVVKHIEPEHLSEIPIPNPPAIHKIEIHNLMMKSFELRDESNQMLDQAEALLVKELNLPPISQFEPNFVNKKVEVTNFEIKLSKLAGRFEASYHTPIVQTIYEHITKYANKVTTLNDSSLVSKIVLPSRFKRIYVGEGQGVLFFGGKELLQLTPKSEKFLSLTHHNDRIKRELTLQENMIMITCSGTIGKVAIVPKHWEGWTANQHIIRVIPVNQEIAGYIFAWLNTEYGKQFITRFNYGAVVDEIDARHVGQIHIPLLKNQNIQRKINRLVLAANRKRDEAYLIEQQAIQLIEDRVIYSRYLAQKPIRSRTLK